MLEPPPQASRRAWGWLAALLDGETTPWSHWVAEAEPRLPFFPAAQQLEALRRLNLAAHELGHRPDADAAEQLIRAGITDRNRGDLVLVGESGSRFGPPSVDPSELRARDLLPVVVGPIARRLAETPPRRPRRTLPLTRGWQLAGDPWATFYAREAQNHARRRPGHRVMVLAGDLGTLALHAWAEHAVTGGTLGFRAWMRSRVEHGRMPAVLDVAAQARTAAEAVGRPNIQVVTDASLVPLLAALPTLDPVAVDLARWVGRPLGVHVPQRQRRQLLLRELLPRTTRDAASPGLTAPWAGVLTEHARRQGSALESRRYPVTGSLEDLIPPSVEPSAFPADSAVLDRAFDLLLDPKLFSLEGTAR
ncbi:hypothetical protein [Nocardioides montaniterrae]